MTDVPRRPILKLKTPPAPKEAPKQAANESRWKCKPCGGLVILTGAEAPEAEIRCPKCHARLGLARDFSAPAETRRVRARPALPAAG